MKWVLIGAFALALLGVAAFLLLRGSTVYFHNPSGYTAFSSIDSPVHRTDRAGLLAAVERLLKGDLYDLLWVSHEEDQMAGVTLTQDEGTPTLDVNFWTHREAARIARFRKAMAEFGYPCTEDSEGHNGGMDEEHRTTTFEYRLPGEPKEVAAFTAAVLDHLQGAGDEFYATATRLARGTGLEIVRNGDPLSQVLRARPE